MESATDGISHDPAPVFADLGGWRKIALGGRDAEAWLNDLVSADVAGLAPGEARRSLLLSPTGRVLAEFTVASPAPSTAIAMEEGALLLLQDPEQSRPIDALLARYVLSSDVLLQDRSDDLTLASVPRPPIGWTPDVAGAAHSAPSVLGSGVDLIGLAVHGERLREALSGPLSPASAAVLEAWRVIAGRPRLGVDVQDDDLPAEAGLMDAVAFDKGCYLGQEAVAKVRNLGHPRRLLLSLTTDAVVEPGEPVLVEGAEAGRVTSAVRSGSGTVALARIRWDARDRPLRTVRGAAMQVTGAGSDPAPGGG